MRKPILTLALLAASLAGNSAYAADPAIKLITVSISRAYESYWKTKDYDRKLQEDQSRAEEELATMRKQLEAMANDVKAKDEESKNTALSNEARERADADARKKFEEYKNKEAEAQQYVQNTQRSFQIRQKNHRDLMFDEINKIVLDLGKGRGATVIIDTSGPTTFGISSVLYADAGFDITDQVITELNKTKPADFKD